MSQSSLNKRIVTALNNDGVVILPPMDALKSISLVTALPISINTIMLDPWYNKGFGGVLENNEYNKFIRSILQLSANNADHIYLWGFPEIIARFVDDAPEGYNLIAWLTWYYKNNPSVIRGWRSSQNACLHFGKEGALLHPEHFLNDKQKEKQKQGKLRYIPGPTSVLDDQFGEEDTLPAIDDVIEAALLVGFVGKKEQTGHPSQKPAKVYEKLISMTTVDGEIIFDPMCGSGTTGSVALATGRKAILCDISEEYTQLVEKRLGIQRIILE